VTTQNFLQIVPFLVEIWSFQKETKYVMTGIKLMGKDALKIAQVFLKVGIAHK